MNHGAASILAAVLNTLWYAAAVVLAAEVGLRALRGRISAAARCRVWFSVLVLLLLLPFLPALTASLRPRPTPALAWAVVPHRTAAHDTVLLNGAPAPPVVIRQSPGSTHWPLWLIAAWLLAALWRLAALGIALVATRRLKRNARVLRSRREAPQLTTDNRQLTTLLESPALAGPAAVGFLHPAVILPLGLLDHLQPEEREAVLLHEWAHIERGDHWMLLAEHFLSALLVLHPLAVFVQHRIEREREMACDDIVVARTGAAHTYARSLARLHDLRCPLQSRLLAAGLWGRGSSLGDRVESLLQRRRDFRSRSGWVHAAASGALLIILLAAGGLLPRWIAFAQSPADPGVPHYPTPDQPPGTPRLTTLLILASYVAAQAPPLSTFEVARVAPADPQTRVVCSNLTYPGGRLRYENCTLKQFIHFAWNIPMDQIQGGPAWMTSQGYTIEATPPADSAVAKWNPTNPKLPPPPEELLMLRTLLLDRFQLQLRPTAEMKSVLALEIHGDHKAIAPSTDPSVYPVVTWGHDGSADHPQSFFQGYNATMAQFAARIESVLRQPVVDQTALPGAFNFKVLYSANTSAADQGRSLYSALQDLGLRLVSTKAPVPGLTILSAQPPTAN